LVHYWKSEFNKYNKDHNNVNKYSPNCVLDNCEVSFGHDEYMHHLLKQNNHTMPIDAEYIIRYYSLYCWHSFDSYDYLQSEQDKLMKKCVKEFNQFDLYSKNDNLPVKLNPELKEYYTTLMKKYISNDLII